MSPETQEQVAGYLDGLIKRFGMIEKRLPVFAKEKARRSRYYVADNFLRAWLDALMNPVAAINFVPAAQLIERADLRLATVEGFAFEKLVTTLYEERSRKGIGDFALTDRIKGYWDSSDTELDLVALDEVDRRVRLVSCKRDPRRLVEGVAVFEAHVARFLASFPRLADWTVEKVSCAPRLPPAIRSHLTSRGHIAQDLVDLTTGLPTSARLH